MTDQPDPHFPDLMTLLLNTQSLEGFLEELVRHALKLAPAADGCGITLERQGRPLTVTSVGAGAPRLDEAQYGQNDGPCLTALRSAEELMVVDMLAEQRWGSFPAYAAASGTRSSLSLPIPPYPHRGRAELLRTRSRRVRRARSRAAAAAGRAGHRSDRGGTTHR
jgi:hypothetical protein